MNGGHSPPYKTVRNAYTFTGREFDSETGLLYLRARYYDPETGRFVGKDPIGFGGGVNLYNYVDSVGKPLTETNLYLYTGNDPVNWIDPWGLWRCAPGVNCNFTSPMRDALACFDRCTGLDNEITSGRRSGGGQHGRGQACDLNRTNNPDLSRDDAARCRAECFSHGYGQEERNGPNSSDPNGTHFHYQLNTVPGGLPRFNPDIRPYQPSPPR